MTPTQHFDRVSPEDMMSLDAGGGSGPMQVGAILMLGTEGAKDPVPLLNTLALRPCCSPATTTACQCALRMRPTHLGQRFRL